MAEHCQAVVVNWQENHAESAGNDTEMAGNQTLAPKPLITGTKNTDVSFGLLS